MEEQNKLMKRLRREKRQTLEREKKDLQDRQAYLRSKKEALVEEREGLRESLYATMKAGDESSERIILKQLEDNRNDIADINAEFKTNGEVLECYSKVLKNAAEGKSSLLGAAFTGLGTGAAIWLGHESLKKAYQSDVDGTLVNKKSLAVFDKLNPLRLINAKFRK